MIKCVDVMTKDPICCLPDDTVVKAAKLMKTGNIGSIPVVENEQTKKLVGIVTDRDLALTIVAEARDVTDPAAVPAFVESAAKALGGCDIFISLLFNKWQCMSIYFNSLYT